MDHHFHGEVGKNKIYQIIGWREYISFPELKIDKIKAKIDTGARTSVLHAFHIDLFEAEGIKMVSFSVHPEQHSNEKVIHCVNVLHDMRWITSSSGHKELRPAIKTEVKLGQHSWQIEITLTNRNNMHFRFLLARGSIPEKFLISASSSYLSGKELIESVT